MRYHLDDRVVIDYKKEKNMAKQKIPVRFANESTATANVEIDASKLKDIQIFDDEVFATIDDIRIAIRREDYNKLFDPNEI